METLVSLWLALLLQHRCLYRIQASSWTDTCQFSAQSSTKEQTTETFLETFAFSVPGNLPLPLGGEFDQTGVLCYWMVCRSIGWFVVQPVATKYVENRACTNPTTLKPQLTRSHQSNSKTLKRPSTHRPKHYHHSFSAASQVDQTNEGSTGMNSGGRWSGYLRTSH